MARSRRLLVTLVGVILALAMTVQTGMTVQAGSNRDYLDSVNGGVAALIDPSATNTTEIMNATAIKLKYAPVEEESTRVMANVKSHLNIRSEANDKAERLGMLYKDCGGVILERENGWTKLQSGNLIGWAKDEYLLFDEEARNLANDAL